MSSTLEHQIAKYADHLEGLTAPVSEAEIVSRGRPASTRVRNGLVAAAAAAVAIVVVGAVAVLTQFGGSEGPITAPPPTSPLTATTLPEVPGALFSWSGDDLAEWVTEDEMTDALKGLVGEEIDGEATLNPDADDSAWSLGGWRVFAHNGDHRPAGGVVEPTRTDPRLPEGVTYDPLTGFAHGFYGLSGPNSDESICLTLLPPGEGLGYPHDTSLEDYWDPDTEKSEVEVHEDRVFALASMMLQEMGWVGPDPTAVFDMGADSFCEWFSAEDMNEIFSTAQQRAGTDYALEKFTPEGCDSSSWGSQWNPPDLQPQGKSHRWSTQGRLLSQEPVTSGARRVLVHIEPVDRPEGNPFAWRALGFQVKSTPFVEHPLLDNGVSYQRRTYQYGWQDGWDGFLKVDERADEILYFGLSVDDGGGGTEWTPEYEGLSLAVVNELLHRMNWTDFGE